MALIEIKQLSKKFKGHVLFKEINASFDSGLIYGIIGANGSGKSVLFKLICGFLSADEGHIVIDPTFKSSHKNFPEKFGIIIDRPGYIGSLTGLENLQKLASIQRIINDEDIKNAMTLVGLQPDLSLKVRNYSLGMKQKLAIAQAIMEKQDVLLLDEPFNALDQSSVQNIRNLLLEYKANGKTIILTSHNKEDIDLLCDHVYQINNHTLEQLY